MSLHRDPMAAQLEDLVHRNRTLDQTIKRLQQELEREQDRAKDALASINTRWSRERAEWREGCDTLIACHTIAHLRTTVTLEAERLSVLKCAEDARTHQITRLQRDYRLTLFQMREFELEQRISELEDELDDVAARDEVAAHKSAAQLADLTSQLDAKQDALQEAHRAKDDLQEKHSETLQELATLRTSVESTSSQFERASLQLDGAKASVAELTRANEDLKRTNADLRRQLENWQTLETKGTAEVDAQRRRRVELEVHSKALESRISDAEKRESEISAALEKERARVEKLKARLADWKQATDEAREETDKLRTEAVEASKKFEKQQKTIEKLRADLAERARVGPHTPSVRAEVKDRNSSRARESERAERTASSDEENEIVERIVIPSSPAPVKNRPKPKAVSRAQAASDAEASNSGYEGKRTIVAKSKKSKPAQEEDSSKPSIKGKGKSGKGKGRADDEVVEEESARHPTKATGKRKAERDVSRAGSMQAMNTSTASTSGGEAVPRKKKRTINIFGSAQDTTFEWGTLSQGDAGLGIPTILSPVKESETIPSRSASLLGRVGSVIGSFRR